LDHELLEAIRAIVREELRGNGELLDVEGLAEALKVPVSWVYEQSRQGLIPSHKVGKYRRFELEAVLSHLKRGGSNGKD
jgi:excisionase family DNA binding protein